MSAYYNMHDGFAAAFIRAYMMAMKNQPRKGGSDYRVVEGLKKKEK